MWTRLASLSIYYWDWVFFGFHSLHRKDNPKHIYIKIILSSSPILIHRSFFENNASPVYKAPPKEIDFFQKCPISTWVIPFDSSQYADHSNTYIAIVIFGIHGAMINQILQKMQKTIKISKNRGRGCYKIQFEPNKKTFN